MKEKSIEIVITIVLIVIMAINVFFLICINLPMNADAILQESKATYMLPDGFSPENTKLSLNESSSPAGWVVRYASNGCIYCKLDFYWEHYASKLESLNYRIILLLPKEEDKFDDDRIISKTLQQLAFIKPEWIKQFRFTGTPTVVIFDNNGRVLWRHAGLLKEVDYNSLKMAIEGNKN